MAVVVLPSAARLAGLALVVLLVLAVLLLVPVVLPVRAVLPLVPARLPVVRHVASEVALLLPSRLSCLAVWARTTR